MKIRVIVDKYEHQGLYKGSEHEANYDPATHTYNFKNLGKLWALDVMEGLEIKEKTACDFLSTALYLLEERGKDYDQAQGERSMGRTVNAFNSITGKALTEAEGWLLLQLLKDVRQWQNPYKYHADSAEDCISYAALKAEALSKTKEEL